MEFVSLHEGGEPEAAPAKLELEVQTISSDLSVLTTSCLLSATLASFFTDFPYSLRNI